MCSRLQISRTIQHAVLPTSSLNATLYAMAQILAQSTTLLSRYEQAAQKHPISTKVATCFVGFALGDVVAQSISRPVRVRITTDGIINGTETLREKVEVDVFRALRMALFGALIAAPQMHMFHGWMEKVCFALRCSRFSFNSVNIANACNEMCTPQLYTLDLN